LNYQPGASTFGVNFLRYHHRTQEWSRWADITPQFLPEEAGHLTGLALPKERLSSPLTLMQYAAAGRNMPNRGGGSSRSLISTGLDLRYEVSNNLTGLLAVNPDFSQVEDDVLGLAFNYNEKVRSDNRPFFREGAGFFGNRTYFYSNRVPAFDYGLKSFGRMGGVQLGLLATQAAGGRRDYVARMLHEVGPAMNVSATVVGTDRPDFTNHLFGFDAAGRIGRHLTLDTGIALTSTRGRAGDGTRARFMIGREDTRWSAGVGVYQTEKGFFPADGFLASDELETRALRAFVTHGGEFANGPLRSANVGLTFMNANTLTGLFQRQDVTLYGGVETRGDIRVDLSTSLGPYRPRNNETGAWSSTMNYDRLHTASVLFDTRNDRRGYGLVYAWGTLGGGKYSDFAPLFWLKPNPRSFLSYSFEQVESFGRTSQHVLSLGWQLNPERSIAARWVQTGPDHGYRLAFRQQVRRGLDVYAIYNTERFSPERFTIKLVSSLSPRWGF
jgi:hypothetical protein